MQIHFIWINESNDGYLKNAAIDFSSRFSFKIEANNNQEYPKSYILYIENNIEYIPSFFEKSNITNVTAIIGKNGSGKSSILKYIKSHLPQGLEANIKDDVYAYSWFDDNLEIFYVDHPDEITLDLKDKTGLFKQRSYSDFWGANQFQLSSKLGEVDYIYYNYLLDHGEGVDNWSIGRGLRIFQPLHFFWLSAYGSWKKIKTQPQGIQSWRPPVTSII